MDKNDRLELRNRAVNCLNHATYSPTRLIAIHTGVILVLSVLLAAVDYILEQQIGSTGGLGGIGSRTVLVTAQAVLRLSQTVLLPFWQMGYVYVTMKFARQESVSPWDLCEGFRRFGGVLRLNLLKAVLAIFVCIASVNIATTVFLMTPFSAPFLEALAPLMADPNAAADPNAVQEALAAISTADLLPLPIITAIVFLALGAPLLYHYRMASYFLLDGETPKALSAMRSSRKLMRYLCLDLFKLDLSFWWFYALELLIGLVCYGDLILNLLGVQLPFNPDVAYFLFFGLYLAGEMALYLWRKNRVEVTYACTYEFLRSRHDPKPQPKPQKQNWTY